MKKKIEICYSRSIKINTGNYQQESPMYSAKTILESEKDDGIETAEFNRLKTIVDPLLLADYQAARKDAGHLRIRVKDGKKYPSVTSIINPDVLKIDPAYALRGTEIHRLINVFIDSGGKTWEEPKVDIAPLKYEDIKYKEWFEKGYINLKRSTYEQNKVFYNEEYMFSGEVDLIEDGKFLYEFKTGSWKVEQLGAYAVSLGIADACIVDLKHAKMMGLSTEKTQLAFERFLVLRGKFAQRFGV